MRVHAGILASAALLASVGAAAAGARSAAAPEAMTFSSGCGTGDRVLVAAVGDLLFHDTVQARALAPGGSFRTLWRPLLPVLEGADLTYGNLEGPAARGVRAGGISAPDPGRVLDRIVYGRARESLVFNFHPSVIADLAASGFKVIGTGNNHAADRGPLGIERTIEELRLHGTAHTGTRRRGEEGQPWSTVVKARGMAVAWLACTYSTNGMPDPHRQVLNCYSDKASILDEVRSLARSDAVDAVIVAPHWGHEDSHLPLASDRRWAREVIEAGAAAVVGAHPHVLQPWEKITTSDGREGLVIYSLGNFISNQRTLAQRTGVIALIELMRGSGKASVSAAGFVPTWVDVWRGHVVAELTAGPEGRTAALVGALRILPAGNRVDTGTFRTLPRSCVGTPNAERGPSVMAAPATSPPSGPPDASVPTVPYAGDTGRPGAVIIDVVGTAAPGVPPVIPRRLAPDEPDMADEGAGPQRTPGPRSALPEPVPPGWPG